MISDKSKTNSVAVDHKDSQWRNQTAEKATHIKREPTGSSSDSLQSPPFSK